MKRTIAIAASLLLAVALHAEIRGTWSVDHSWKTEPGSIHVNLNRPNNHFGSAFPISAFSGLTASQVESQGDARFTLRRDAGVVAFDGSFRDGEGVGYFVFTPDQSFLSKLRAMNVRSDGNLDDEDLFSLALHDISTDFIRNMRAVGYDEPLDHYVSMRIFRVTPELIADLRSLGYDRISYDDLINSRVHKVTPEYIRAMKAAGYKLSMEQLVTTRIHKASPEFLQQMASAGYSNISYDDMINFRIHGVTPEFVGELRVLGYKDISGEDLVTMRIHRVTPAYIRDVEKAGYHHVPVEKLIEMRIHGIDTGLLSKLK
jgi:hypothetical protein